MIRAIFARFIKPPPVTDNQPVGKVFPEIDLDVVITKRGMAQHNRTPSGVAVYVRTNTILARGNQ